MSSNLEQRSIRRQIITEDEIKVFGLEYISRDGDHLTFGLGNERYVLRQMKGIRKGEYNILRFYITEVKGGTKKDE